MPTSQFSGPLHTFGFSTQPVSTPIPGARRPTCAAPVGGTIPSVTVTSTTMPGFGVVSNVPLLAAALCDHPDCSLVNFLLYGFAYGFDLGYRGPITPGSHKNLLSARFHHKVVTRLARLMFHLSWSCMFLLLARWRRKILIFASSWIFLLPTANLSMMASTNLSTQCSTRVLTMRLIWFACPVCAWCGLRIFFAGYALGYLLVVGLPFGGRSHVYIFRFVASLRRDNFVALTCRLFWMSLLILAFPSPMMN